MLKLNRIVQTGLSVVLVVMVYSAFLSGVWTPSYGYFLWVGEVFREKPISQLLITFSMYSWLAGIACVAYCIYCFFYRDVLVGHVPAGKVLLTLFLSVFFLYLISFVFFENETFTLETLDTANHFYTGSLREKLLLAVGYLVMGPIFEEIFFRGIMMGAILNMPLITNEKVRMATACIIPSLLYISFYTQYEYVWTYILLFLFAMLLSVARIISRGLLLPMLLHSFSIVCVISFSFLLLGSS